jgi:hypothetical protein
MLLLCVIIRHHFSACTRYAASEPGVASLIGLTFDGCTSESQGGAVSLISRALSALVENSVFAFCSARGASGGAIYFAAAALTVRASRMFSCSAAHPFGNAAVFASCSGPDPRSVFAEVVTATCTGGFDTWSIGAIVRVSFTRSNLTRNSVDASASAVAFRESSSLDFSFVVLLANAGPDFCLAIAGPSASVRCVLLRGNVGRALFDGALPFTVSESIVADNPGMRLATGAVTFARCFLDAAAFAERSADVRLIACVPLPAGLEFAAACDSRLPGRVLEDAAATTAQSDGPSEDDDEGGSPGVVALLVIIFVPIVTTAGVVFGTAWYYRPECFGRGEARSEAPEQELGSIA